jgi:hypothetical protein
VRDFLIRAFHTRAEAASDVIMARSSAETRRVSVSVAIIFEVWAGEAATDTWCAGKVAPKPAGAGEPIARERWLRHSAKASRLNRRASRSGEQRSDCGCGGNASAILPAPRTNRQQAPKPAPQRTPNLMPEDEQFFRGSNKGSRTLN